MVPRKGNRGRWTARILSIFMLFSVLPISSMAADTAGADTDILVTEELPMEVQTPDGKLEPILPDEGDGLQKSVERVQSVETITPFLRSAFEDETGILMVTLNGMKVHDGVETDLEGRIYNLPGAVLTLYDADMNPINTHTYKGNGSRDDDFANRAYFDGLRQNTTYYLKQTGGVAGFRMDPTTYTIQVGAYNEEKELVDITILEYPNYGVVVGAAKTPLIMIAAQDPLVFLTINGTDEEITVDKGEEFDLVATVRLPADVYLVGLCEYQEMIIRDVLGEKLELVGAPTLVHSATDTTFGAADYMLATPQNDGVTTVETDVQSFDKLKFASYRMWSYRTTLTLTMRVRVKADTDFYRSFDNESQVDFTNSSGQTGTVVSNKVYIHPKTVDMVDVTAEKIWLKAPAQVPDIAILLFCDGEPLGEPVTLTYPVTEYTWENLYKYSETGALHQYEVREAALENYTQTVEKDATGYHFTITNTRNPIQITAVKKWVGGGEQRPDIQLQLYRDGEVFGDAVTLVSPEDTYVWTVDEFDTDGKAYTYTVDEVNVPEKYEKSVAVSEDGCTFTITNTCTVKEMPGNLDPAPKEPGKPDSPSTGDFTSGIIPVFALATGFIGMTAGTVIKRRRQK